MKFQGPVATLLWKWVEQYAGKSEVYPYCGVVNSSGWGKTRSLRECSAQGHLVIYVNTTVGDDKMGFPGRNKRGNTLMSLLESLVRDCAPDRTAVELKLVQLFKKWVVECLEWCKSMC